MSKFEKPIFTKDELDKSKTNIDVGYKFGEIRTLQDSRNKIAQTISAAKERFDGTAKKRAYHEEINSFGYAIFNDSDLRFGIKWKSINGNGPTRIGHSAIKKYKQLLGYNLEQVGWNGIQVDEIGDYVVPLDNEKNLDLLQTLATTIGFSCKYAKMPDIKHIKKLRKAISDKGRTFGIQSQRTYNH